MSKVGLLSDSHGQVLTTRAAMQTLIDAGADLIIHLGDIGSEQVLDELICDQPVHVVFGNCDWDWQPLAKYAQHMGLIVDHPVGRLTFAEKTIVFQHGDNRSAMAATLSGGSGGASGGTGNISYLCHGHTHMKRDEHIGLTRVINPGALQRAREYTVAVLDIEQDQLTFYPIARS